MAIAKTRADKVASGQTEVIWNNATGYVRISTYNPRLIKFLRVLDDNEGQGSLLVTCDRKYSFATYEVPRGWVELWFGRRFSKCKGCNPCQRCKSFGSIEDMMMDAIEDMAVKVCREIGRSGDGDDLTE